MCLLIIDGDFLIMTGSLIRNKVLWVADFTVEQNIGGAQRTDYFIIEEGKRRGYDFTFLNYNSDKSILDTEYDIVVSGNLENLSNSKTLLNYLFNHKYHVRYEHDSNSYLSKDVRYTLFNSTKHNFFLSKFHYETFVNIYGDIFKNVDIVTSPIDGNIFKDLKQEREDKILYIGFMHHLKGINNFFTKVLNNPHIKFVMACWGNPILEMYAKLFKNIEWLGKKDYSEMHLLYNKYSKIYYHPSKFEPFCRSIGEAILCGMDFDCSDNIGAIHDYKNYGLNEMKNMCLNSPNKFWNIIESDI